MGAQIAVNNMARQAPMGKPDASSLGPREETKIDSRGRNLADIWERADEACRQLGN